MMMFQRARFKAGKALCLLLAAMLLLPASSGFMQPLQAAEPSAGSLEALAQQERFKGAIAFSLGEPLALAQGIIAPIDAEDDSVVAWLDPQTNRAYAPLRFVAQSLRAELDWQADEQRAILRLQGKEVQFRAGEKQMIVDGNAVDIDAAAQLVGARIYLPLRALAEAFGLSVHFQDGLIVLQDEAALKLLREEEDGKQLLSLLGLRLQPLARLGSYENLVLLLNDKYQYFGEGETIRFAADGKVLNELPSYYDDLDYLVLDEMAVEYEAAPDALPPTDTSNAARAEAGAVSADMAEESAAEDGDFSTTNTQVAGIDEADIVKTDGTYLYLISNDEAVIVKAVPAEQMEVLARISYDRITPLELYIEGDRLVVIGSRWQDAPASTSRSVSPYYYDDYYDDYYGGRAQLTQALIYDISEREQPQLLRTVEIEGSYISSRRIDSCYYLLTNKSLHWRTLLENKESAQPLYSDSLQHSELQQLPYEAIRCFPDFEQTNYLMVAAFDAGQEQSLDLQAYLGAGETIYMSPHNLYVALGQYRYYSTYEPDDIVPWSYSGGEYLTRIFRFGLDGARVNYAATGEVPGTLLNQFSMDEHNGYFRLATTRDQWGWWGSEDGEMRNQLYVLDDSLTVVGSIEDIAPGEKIYSARFMGDRAFIVTFKTVDPLFVLDLKEPTAPKILGELKIPGYSDYLHPVNEDYLLGFGKDAIALPVKDSRGEILYENAYYLGMKLSLFDVRDLANPKEAAMVIIGDRGTESSLLYNHKALLYNRETGFLAFPVTESRILSGPKVSENGYPHYGETVFDGLIAFKIDPEAGEEGIRELGRITQQTNKLDEKYGLNLDYQRQIERGLYIGRTVYTLSQSCVQANSMDDFALLGSVALDK